MVKRAPDGWHSITPRVFVDDPAALVAFLKQAFDGQGDLQAERPTEIRIGDSVVMVARSGPRPPTRSAFYLYVADADATYARAIAAGARSVEELVDTPYGDRRAMVEDPAGNTWQIATPFPSS